MLCVVLAVTLPAFAARAEAPAGAPRPTVPADPWNPPAGAAIQREAADSSGAQQPDPAEADLVHVELRADSGAVRLERVGVDGRTTPLCFAPCRRLLPRNTLYVIAGDGVPATSQFLLPDNRSEVTLDVRAGSTERRGAGSFLLLGGLVVGYLGLAFAEAGLLSASADDSGTRRTNSGEVAGGVMMLAGLLASIGGLVMVLSSSTKVTSSTGATFSKYARPRDRSTFALTPGGFVF